MLIAAREEAWEREEEFPSPRTVRTVLSEKTSLGISRPRSLEPSGSCATSICRLRASVHGERNKHQQVATSYRADARAPNNVRVLVEANRDEANQMAGKWKLAVETGWTSVKIRLDHCKRQIARRAFPVCTGTWNLLGVRS